MTTTKKRIFKVIKYNGDDQYSYAVFKAVDIKGLKGPISYPLNAKPLVSGCMRSEAKHYANKFEKEYLEKQQGN